MPNVVGASIDSDAEHKKIGLPGADSVLRAAAKAHGGKHGASDMFQPDTSLFFAFIRKVPDGDSSLVVENRYTRKDKSRRLEISVISGHAKGSVTVITPDQTSWVTVEGESLKRDLARTKDVVERFSPEQVLSIPFRFSSDVYMANEWVQFRNTAKVSNNSTLGVVLKSKESTEDGLSLAAFDTATGLLSKIVWKNQIGSVSWTFEDYRLVASGVYMPFHSTIQRDGVTVEEVELLDLQILTEDDSTSFLPPEAN